MNDDTTPTASRRRLARVLAQWRKQKGLTPSECEVAAHTIRGLSNKEIGQALGISVSTVRCHLLNLSRKLNVSSRGELAYLAFCEDPIPDE